MIEPREVLKRVFGYEHFHPLQEKVISHVLDGQDALVLMPTGGGKSLCFQVPALCRDGLTLVVSPLVALMRDQVEALKANGVAADLLNSTQNAAEAEFLPDAERHGPLRKPPARARPSSNKAPASGCAPKARRAAHRTRRSGGLPLCG